MDLAIHGHLKIFIHLLTHVDDVLEVPLSLSRRIQLLADLTHAANQVVLHGVVPLKRHVHELLLLKAVHLAYLLICELVNGVVFLELVLKLLPLFLQDLRFQSLAKLILILVRNHFGAVQHLCVELDIEIYKVLVHITFFNLL